MLGRQDVVGNNFPVIWVGILENWERVEEKLERVERLIKQVEYKLKFI